MLILIKYMFLKEFVTFNENDLAHKMKVILNSNQQIFLPNKNTTETCSIKTDLFWLHVFHNQNSAIYRNIFYFTTGFKIYMLFLNFLVSFATIMTFLMLSWQKFVWSSIVCYWGQCYMLQWIAQPEKHFRYKCYQNGTISHAYAHISFLLNKYTWHVKWYLVFYDWLPVTIHIFNSTLWRGYI